VRDGHLEYLVLALAGVSRGHLRLDGALNLITRRKKKHILVARTGIISPGRRNWSVKAQNPDVAGRRESNYVDAEDFLQKKKITLVGSSPYFGRA